MMADKKTLARLLKTARGQVDGLLKMVEEDRYCMDISQQLLATQAILKKVNHMVLKAHLNHCVRSAFDGDEKEGKLQELADLISIWEKI